MGTQGGKLKDLAPWQREVGPFLDPSFRVMCVCMHARLLQLCPALCDSMDCSPPGSSVHGISQARILEWGAMPTSRGSS